MKPIHLILSIALLAGGACGDQQEPYYGNSEVKMPQINSEWNLELMPNDRVKRALYFKSL